MVIYNGVTYLNVAFLVPVLFPACSTHMVHYKLEPLVENGRFQTAAKLSKVMAMAQVGFSISLFQASIDMVEQSQNREGQLDLSVRMSIGTKLRLRRNRDVINRIIEQQQNTLHDRTGKESSDLLHTSGLGPYCQVLENDLKCQFPETEGWRHHSAIEEGEEGIKQGKLHIPHFKQTSSNYLYFIIRENNSRAS